MTKENQNLNPAAADQVSEGNQVSATQISGQGAVAAVPGPVKVATPAHVIKTAAEAIEIAHGLAAQFKIEAAARDRDRRLPLAELDLFSQSGLWGITVPKAYGGADLPWTDVTEVIKIIAAADPSLGQIPQNHLAIVDVIRYSDNEAQKKLLFAKVLEGYRFGNAFSEFHTKKVTEFKTTVRRQGEDWVVNGRKFYTTGALLAHYVPIGALDEQDQHWLAFADRNAPGLSVINDWSGFGQRTTASGTVLIENVVVPAIRVVPAYLAGNTPTAAGPVSQIIQAAVDAGIAKGTVEDTIAFVRTHARPWADSGLDHATQDPYTIAAIGDLTVRLHAAEAILERAARQVDAAIAHPGEDAVARASVIVGQAKILTTEIALLAGTKLHELGGTRSTLAEHGLDRHWRNARTHTLHDPVRWKFHLIGNYVLNGVTPPRHAWN